VRHSRLWSFAFGGDLLERIDLEIALGEEALELSVLGLQGAQAFDVGRLQGAEMTTPLVSTPTGPRP